MCGIAGILRHPSCCMDNLEDDVSDLIQRLIHRGPDDSGIWLDKRIGIGLGHRRLSVIDLSNMGHQPMFSSNRRYAIVFNGEIYNHLSIKEEIASSNNDVTWRGNSDTEVLLAAIELWGIEKSLSKFTGMFVFAIWDQKDQSLCLVRDRIGEKPLYYGIYKKNFFFGSELSAFYKHPDWIGEISRKALALFMRYGYIPSPYSIYHNVLKLLPGTYIKISIHDKLLLSSQLPEPISYWSILDSIENTENTSFNTNLHSISKKIEKLLSKSITDQMIADVPVGAFLSGGIDSSLIAAIMQKNSLKPVKTFSIGFVENNYDEAKYSKLIAKQLGTDHRELYIGAGDALSIIDLLPRIWDEPFADSSQIPTLLVCHLARRHVKVCLSGDGGDELFCGYDRYIKDTQRWKTINKINPSFRKLISIILDKSPYPIIDFILSWTKSFRPCDGKNKSYSSAIYDFGKELRISEFSKLYDFRMSHWIDTENLLSFSRHFSSFDKFQFCKLDSIENLFQYMTLFDLLQYLPDDILVKIDRAAMSVGLETRIPFLDHKLVEYANKIPLKFKLFKGNSKFIIKQILYKYIPPELIDRPKMGFSAPIAKWLKGPLREWCDDILNPQNLRRDGYLNSDLVHLKWNEHLKGKHNWQHLIWNVLMFQTWLENRRT